MCTLRVGDMNNPQINTHEYTQRACVCVSMSLFIIIFMIHPIRPSSFPYHCPPVTRTHTHTHAERRTDRQGACVLSHGAEFTEEQRQ